ncbi:hypothetical protein GCM10023206_04180 [Acinetobacter puyangensis]|uniref:Outer-membrane receptor for ferric coprogen and ferric-rhodotorulic acid n=1 Tax=Acinetobacter puyangensis TaxID=1096779 RepID=A0A240EC66_9GAMM|nr:TonB-dependent receptor plug domain-containing protein [Acinetobacter puyangensis]SNX46136.1 outer-membrane receptor for ferric coprogen and ferric-rhodotorulic acid [Acinetobacter puyangensis]
MAQLPVITVSAEQSTTEGTASYTAKSSSTSTKLNLSHRETPQTVKVLTREYLDDKNIDSYQQLIDQITGVTLIRYDTRGTPSSRGFSTNYMLFDGNPLGVQTLHWMLQILVLPFLTVSRLSKEPMV